MDDITQKISREKARFLLRNLLRGIFWLIVIIGGYILIKRHYNFDLVTILGPLYENSIAVYLIFLISEIVFGIIPPEFFMLWSLRHGDISLYVQNIFALAAISYIAGVTGYYIGSYFNGTRIYRLLRKNYLRKFEEQFNRFGGFLIVVASLTPLPFSGICMLVGAVKYNLRKFIWIALMRFVRFAVYSIIIWEANTF